MQEILGKDSLADSHKSLSDIIEIGTEIANEHFHLLVEKHGEPIVEQGEMAGEPTSLTLVGLGKLGGQEPNFHSDVDILFLYDGAGNTGKSSASRYLESPLL